MQKRSHNAAMAVRGNRLSIDEKLHRRYIYQHMHYTKSMRRIPASVLLLLFSYMLITPLLFAEPESKIAACCRRNGKHHCAKMAHLAHATDAGDTARLTNSKTCPLFPTGASAPVTGDVAVPSPNPVFIAAVKASPALVEEVEVQRRVAAARAWLKRGPPSLLA